MRNHELLFLRLKVINLRLFTPCMHVYMCTYTYICVPTNMYSCNLYVCISQQNIINLYVHLHNLRKQKELPSSFLNQNSDAKPNEAS
jgi:hypothetical protein